MKAHYLLLFLIGIFCSHLDQDMTDVDNCFRSILSFPDVQLDDGLRILDELDTQVEKLQCLHRVYYANDVLAMDLFGELIPSSPEQKKSLLKDLVELEMVPFILNFAEIFKPHLQQPDLDHPEFYEKICRQDELIEDLVLSKILRPSMVIGTDNFFPGFGLFTITKCIIKYSSVRVLDHLIMANVFKESSLVDIFYYTSFISTKKFQILIEYHWTRLSAKSQFYLMEFDYKLRNVGNNLRHLALSNCEPEILPCIHGRVLLRLGGPLEPPNYKICRDFKTLEEREKKMIDNFFSGLKVYRDMNQLNQIAEFYKYFLYYHKEALTSGAQLSDNELKEIAIHLYYQLKRYLNRESFLLEVQRFDRESSRLREILESK
ncbi:hypothetical protein ROZALSC1DRAFT_30205 [Rozella allomycis CSF55]|uniref:Uncharacterized protein n=1 Tax=Rozella allomycis (strain CSF55) TaxID=988480 RepID=A0A075B183_ROZAC|nr:hypothetical protein O9G_004005 [Rozella allomycis CSF55]RKP18057.1 hypothetical protein ROZALSC1DRAFT_30205 [Rozella allomycis CSF55]|eukprot:EPZ36346.1 hypothetical protein O9G_004005 [Rozella allomycis CSF55]